MGRRWGKSTLAGAVSIAYANQGAHCGWGSPNYKNSRPLWRWVEQICKPLEKVGVQISQAERVVTFPTGGFLAIYSLDNPDSVRSEAFHLFIVDESAKVADPEALNDALEPTLADYDGIRWDISTPRGKNEFFTEWNLANEDKSNYSHAWHAPSSDNPSPNILKFVAKAKERVEQGRMTQRSFDQELMALFVEGGTFFQNVRACAVLKPSTRAQHPGHNIVVGGDFAQQDDFTWLTARCIECNCVCEIDYFSGLSWTIQLARVAAFCQRWGHEEKNPHTGQTELVPASILPERNSIGSPLIEQMQAAGLTILLGPDGKPGFYTTQQTKQQIVTSLFSSLATASLKILDDSVLTMQLEAFEEHPTTYGTTYSAPSGLHDDGVMSLAITEYAAQHAKLQIWI